MQNWIVPNFGGGLVYRHMPAIPETAKADAASEAKLNESNTLDGSEKLEKADVIVAGSLAIDLSCDYAPLDGSTETATPVPQTSNPAIIQQSLGGVGHNVAISASRVGSSVLFCSVVGDDLSGRAALSTLGKEGLTTQGIQTLSASSGTRTAQYIAVNDANKNLVVAVADMGIMELPTDKLNFEQFWGPMITRTKPQWVVLDANWSPVVLAKWMTLAKTHNIRVAFEPVSTAKCRRVFSALRQLQPTTRDSTIVPSNAISLAAPNQLELNTLYITAREIDLFDADAWFPIIDAMGITPSTTSRERLTSLTSTHLVDAGIPQKSIHLLPFIPCIVTKLGATGALLTQFLMPRDPRLTEPESAPYILSRGAPASELVGGVYMRLFPAARTLEAGDVVSVNAAGDTLLGVLVSGLARGRRVEDVVAVAQEASLRTLISVGGVSENLGGLLD